MRYYLLILFFLYSSICLSSTSLGGLIVGWPEGSYSRFDDGLTFESKYSVWLDKKTKSLKQHTDIYTFQRTFSTDKFTTVITASSQQDEITYDFDHNTLQVNDDNDAWSLSTSSGHWNILVGNRKQSIGFFGATLSRERINKSFYLNVQNELDDPREDQFIFNHHWRDHLWRLQYDLEAFSIYFNIREQQNNDHGLTINYNFNDFEHLLTFQNTDLNYGLIDLSDDHYSYGEMEWINKGSFWLWRSTFNFNQSDFWSISAVNQKLTFTSVGQASLFNILGQSSNLAGANWFWGLQGSVKSTGVKIDRGWKTDNTEHQWGIGVNKVSPYINSKVYKSLILIGLPNLESEDDLDIDYAYISLVSWESKYNWNSASLKLSISQLVPLYIKEISHSDSSSSSSSHDYKHMGYNINIQMAWYF